MEKILYTTTAVNEDGLGAYTKGNGDKDFSTQISSPRSAEAGTNPEQLFALAYATCLNASIEICRKTHEIRA